MFNIKISSQITNFIENILPVILLLSIVSFVAILLIRLILIIWLYFTNKNYQALKKVTRNTKDRFKKKPDFIKEDDVKFKKKPGLQNNKKDSYKIISSVNKEPEYEKPEIVDIVKPVGFWTSLVLGQKLTYLVSSAKLMNDSNQKGFWTSMVEAQAKAAGRQRGRNR